MNRFDNVSVAVSRDDDTLGVAVGLPAIQGIASHDGLGSGGHGVDGRRDGLKGFFKMQVLCASHLCGGLTYPSAFLVFTIVDANEINEVEVGGLTVGIDSPTDVETA